MKRRKKFSSLAISALMVLSLVSIIALQAAPVSANPEPENYYVRIDGSNDNDGLSWENAKATIDNAVKTASPNDTIHVGDGTYAENPTVNKENLTITSQNGAAVTIVQALNPNDHVFDVTESGVSIIGFTVENATGDSKAGIALVGVENCVIENNTVGNNFIGIWLSSSSNNTLTNNTCGNNSRGIELWSSSNYNTLTYNTSMNNTSEGITLNSSSNNTISNNTCENNMDGIALDTSDNNTLTNNITENNTFLGICIDSSENTTISNNTIDNNASYGIYIDGITSSAIIVFNNITNHSTSASGVYLAGVATTDATRMLVNYNNIVGNSPYGIYNDGTGELNARYNWWGDASGPGGVGPGTGDNVEGDVDYALWLTEPFENITINWNLQGVSAPSDNVEVENIAEVTVDLTEDGRVAITVMEEISGAPIPGDLLQAGMFVDISTVPENIAENIWITLHYTDGDVAGIDEGSLKLYYWSSVDNAWHLCDNITVDVNNNTVTGWVSHLTPFGMFGVPPTPAVPPALTAPANGAFTNDSTPTFDWELVSGAASYSLQYATDSGFTQNLTTGSSTASDYTPTTTLADGTWYWRVQTVDAVGNTGDWSSTWSFTIDTATPTVTISPSLGATLTATGWTLTTTNSSIEISGSVRDATSVTVKINDKVATVVDDSFRKTVDLMVLGTNTFTIAVTDAAGNTTTRTLSVIRAGVEPPPVAEPAISSEQAVFIGALVVLVIVLMVFVKMALVKKY
ncbi:MAG: hypothetical protein CEE41_00380 [Hadesarchaea archaeon B3_Hades]|nr:MAG: hypothetical protein CEE41_00380 [Hadesarchaea archaeon B3_Hades]